MSARGTVYAQGFSQKLMKEVYDLSLLDKICNRDYQGEINSVGSVLNIDNIARISEKTYTNTAMSADSLAENNSKLIIDTYKSFYWKEKVLENWLAYIKNPHPTVVTQKADERSRNMDKFAFGFYGDVAAGNRVGTDEETGDVTITAVTGEVVGNGTAFTEAMEGRGFKAAGHTKWYRVKTYVSATSIYIENDEDDVTSHYDGGAIGGSAAYTIEAATPVTITTSNLLDKIAEMKLKLDTAEANDKSSVPEDRWLIVPPEFGPVLVKASGIALHVPAVYDELVKVGMITELQGFKVFQSNRLSGNNTDGFHILAGNSGWMTFAEKLLTAEMEEDLPGDFGTAYKDLFVYGAKVTDTRRHFATELFAKF